MINPNKNLKHNHLLALAVFIIATLLLFLLAFLLAQAIFALTGTPPQPFAYLAAVILGIAIFAFLSLLFRAISLKRLSKTGKAPGNFGQDIIDALERISQGDFTVSLDTDFHNPINDLALSVNNMARELGTMEQQRQEFISNVSHELQSPLTSISGFAVLLKNPGLTETERLHYLDIIETESKRLSKLSDSLLRLNALDSEAKIHAEKYRLDLQLQSVALMLEPHWSAKHIKLEQDSEPLEINADKDLMGQVWINLLQNAIKFTSENGSINVRLWQSNDSLVCGICDSGIGIASGDLPHIFERFYRADKARERSKGGNGLGLALVKRIVEMHGGTVSVRSLPNKGTTFTIVLPHSQALHEAMPE